MTGAKGEKQKRTDSTAVSPTTKDIETIVDELRRTLDRYATPQDSGFSTAKTTPASAAHRQAGRFKGKIVVGPEFFDPLTPEDIKELTGE